MKTILEITRIKQTIEERNGIANTIIRTPYDLGDVAKYFIGNEDRENFLVIGLNKKLQINVINRCSIGTLECSLIHPREVFKSLILHNCFAFAVAHNHPSGGRLEPSKQDLEVTKRLFKSGELIGIRMIDHVIVNEQTFVSLKEKGHVHG